MYAINVFVFAAVVFNILKRNTKTPIFNDTESKLNQVIYDSVDVHFVYIMS